MYKPADKTKISFLNFNQPMGLYMNPDNRWIQIAENPYLQYFIGLPGYRIWLLPRAGNTVESR